MLLRICAALCLVTIATAQTSSMMMPEATPTPDAATTMEATSPTMGSTAPTDPPNTDAPTTDAPLNATDNLDARFAGQAAYEMRRRHFYCLGVNQSRMDFPVNESSANSAEVRPFLWAIFLQYPVLSYLDSRRKESLFDVIATLVRIGSQVGTGDRRLAAFSEDDICVANVYHHEVSQYEESVLVNVYFRGDTVFHPNNTDTETTVSIAQFDETFTIGFNQEVQNSNSVLVRTFEDRDALVINATNPSTQPQTELNKHPGAAFNDDSRDPTVRAVFLASFREGTNLEAALASPNLRPFARNPDPINFGLEPGDIIFAVFGSIFLTVVGGLVLLGFCIHPFFLA